MKYSALKLWQTIAITMARMASSVGLWNADKKSGGTPHFGSSHKFRPRFKPHIPDGKWVMRHHRSR